MTVRHSTVVRLNVRGEIVPVKLVAPDRMAGLRLLSMAPTGDVTPPEIFAWGGTAVGYMSDLDKSVVETFSIHHFGKLIQGALEVLQKEYGDYGERVFQVEPDDVEREDALDGLDLNPDGTVDLEDMR